MWNMFHLWEGVMFIDFQFPAILSFKFQHQCPWIWFCMPMLLQASPQLELHFGAPQVPSAGKIMAKCYASFQLPNQSICSFSFSSVNSSGILPPGFEFEKSPNHHSSFLFWPTKTKMPSFVVLLHPLTTRVDNQKVNDQNRKCLGQNGGNRGRKTSTKNRKTRRPGLQAPFHRFHPVKCGHVVRWQKSS